jgi:hypothetical protein
LEGAADRQLARPNQPEIRAEPVCAESMSQPANASGSAKPELSLEQRRVSQLIEYVRVLIGLTDKPVWSLAKYNNVVLREDSLRNRIGIRHDLANVDGPV